MTYRRPIITFLLLLLGMLLVPGTALGQVGTALTVRVGWGGTVQAGRWHPVYITLSDPTPRAVTLEFRAPHGSFYGMKSRQVLAIGPEAQTFIVYMPLRHYMPEDLSFIVRDATTRRRVADSPAGPYVLFSAGQHTSPGESVLGISGRRATLRPVIDALPGAKLAAGHIDQAELPTSAIGYDCLDVLVLNAPELAAMTAEQQQAIAEWVRGGGSRTTRRDHTRCFRPGNTPRPALVSLGSVAAGQRCGR